MFSSHNHLDERDVNSDDTTFKNDYFQSQEHLNIIHLMSLMRDDTNPSGMCHGFALTALHYHNEGKLSEYDELIASLLEIYHSAFSHGLEDRDAYMKKGLSALNDKQIATNKITIDELFERVAQYHNSQTRNNINDKLEFAPEIESIYDENEITEYLESLYHAYQTECENLEKPFDVSLLLSSSQHTLLLIINDENILIRDINYTHKYFLEGPDQLFALALNQNYKSASLLISTNVFIPQDAFSRKHTLNLITLWQNTPEYQAIHKLDKDKLTRIGKDGNSLLSQAILKKRSDFAKSIINTITEHDDKTIFARALFISILDEDKEMINALLECPLIDVNMPASSLAHGYELSPLCTAMLFGDTSLIEKLSTSKVNVNSCNSIRIELLEDNDRANPHKKSLAPLFSQSMQYYSNHIIHNLTPLHFAALIGNTDTTNFLLRNNAKVMMCDGNVCADELARATGHDDIAMMILDKCKSDLLTELPSLCCDNMYNKSELDSLREIVNDIQLAKYCLEIKSCLDKIRGVATSLIQNKDLDAHFSTNFKGLRTSILNILSQSDPIEDNITSATNLIDDFAEKVRSASIIGDNELNPDDTNPFYNMRRQAIFKIQNNIANNVMMIDTGIINQAFLWLDRFTRLIKSTETSKFIPRVVHQDWKALVADCYNHISSNNSDNLHIIIRKIKSASEYHSNSASLGLTNPISSLDELTKQPLVTPFESANKQTRYYQ